MSLLQTVINILLAAKKKGLKNNFDIWTNRSRMIDISRADPILGFMFHRLTAARPHRTRCHIYTRTSLLNFNSVLAAETPTSPNYMCLVIPFKCSSSVERFRLSTRGPAAAGPFPGS